MGSEMCIRDRLYVTQWRWIQCERYAREHGELGFWSMMHDLSCPSGFTSLWSRTRSIFHTYLKPVRCWRSHCAACGCRAHAPAALLQLKPCMSPLHSHTLPRQVEESCSGLFPPMVQKILIINVPALFSPVWSVVSAFLPQQHKVSFGLPCVGSACGVASSALLKPLFSGGHLCTQERIVLLTTSESTAKELTKYMPEEHLPPHIPR